MNALNEYLEEVMAIRKTCTIKFRGGNGGIAVVNAKISSLYTEEGIQYVLIDAGVRIAVNDIVQVDAVKPEQIG